ncbi:hypothetical protein E2C01_016092 [Portunus trituberculatus]|uniref:Uncharacterized protein n=1 Tax=Portunus trituberculatus TaxID=210409 RepID=A0A5B7DPB5_PORTR|nr:hypothetical protein [Portunus trituberculatus]
MVLLQETTAATFGRGKTRAPPASTYSAPSTTYSAPASSFSAPRKQKTKSDTAAKVRQGTDHLIDGVMSNLQNITATIRNVTKGATEKQLKNLRRVTKFIGPALQIFLQLQSGQNRVTFEDRKMLDEVGTLTQYLTATVLNKPAADHSNNTKEMLPDYTDLLEAEETFPSVDDVDAGAEVPSTEPEPQRESSFVETSPSFAPSPVSAPSPSLRTFGSFRSFPGRQKETPVSSPPSSTRTVESFRSSVAHEEQRPISVFPPSTRTFTSLQASPVTEKPKSKLVLPPLTTTFGSFSSSSDSERQTPSPSVAPPRTSQDFGSSLNTKKPKSASPFSFATLFGALDIFSDRETQTPTFHSSPSTKVPVLQSSKFKFSSPRVQASSQATRLSPAPRLHNLGAKHFGSSFNNRKENKGEQSPHVEEQSTQANEQTTQAPKIQPTVKLDNAQKRYSPSRLLREQMFQNIQSTASSSSNTPITHHSVRPLIGSRAGLRAGRRAGRREVLRRRRLTQTQP